MEQKKTNWRPALLRLINHVLRYDGEMTLTRLQIFMVVADNDGCLVRDIVLRTGLHQSTVARQLAILGEAPKRGSKVALRWVEMRPDHEDPRRVRCYITLLGRKVLSEIETLVE